MIVGLVGRRRVGKDTCAHAFLARGFVRIALADAPKLCVSREYGLPEDLAWWEINKDLPWAGDSRRTHRSLLIAYANAKRQEDPDFWINLTLEECTRLEADGRSVVITDIRFPNEASGLWSKGAYLIKIVRPGIEVFDDPADSGVDSIPLWMFDGIIENVGDVEALHREALAVPHALG